MTSHSSEFIKSVIDRGYMHQCTDLKKLDDLASDKIISAYIGFDCTAPSLHAGSLVQIMMLRLLQRTGHKPIVLMGGGTTKVGDPSGKDESRKLLDDQAIAANMAGIKDVFAKFLKFGDGPTDAIMVNNDDWLTGIEYINFLRDYGRYFSVNRMLSFESVKIRLEREHNLSFLEFNYMILQAYDFLELSRRYGCSLQMGGSDQWGNIINGVELGRRIDQRDIYGLTTPLLTTSSGAKMGKTAAGAIWLNADMLSPYNYWQYWRNTEDADVSKFLRLFTDLSLDEIADLEKAKALEINDVKKRLATEVTKMCHGADAAFEAAETARRTFEEGGLGDALPCIDIPKGYLESGIIIFELFKLAGLATSNGEARRLIKGGGGKLNGNKINLETQIVTNVDLNYEGVIKLSAGKKRHVIVNPV